MVLRTELGLVKRLDSLAFQWLEYDHSFTQSLYKYNNINDITVGDVGDSLSSLTQV